MLSELEVGRYHAFGFVVLRGCLAQEELAGLEAAYARVIAQAPPYDYFGNGGTRMALHYEDADVTFARLVRHPRIDEAVRDLYGRSALFVAGDLWWNMDDTPWHSDGSPGRQPPSFKVTIYLDPTTAEQGALRVVPGSHHPAFCAAILGRCGMWDQRRPRLRLPEDEVPGAVAVETLPGDVVLWDNRMWHAAPRRADGRPRRALFQSFLPDPGDDLAAQEDVRAAIDAFHARPFLYGRRLLETGGAGVREMARRTGEIMGRDVCEPSLT